MVSLSFPPTSARSNSFPRELAELLGQVKPPVATREEIDKSGLQIINSSELAQYEQEGKVASNCAERVSLLSRLCTIPRVTDIPLPVSHMSG